VNRLLEGLGGFAARRHWVILIGWVIILGVVVGASHLWGGSYVNNYTVPGSGSQDGLNVLNASYPSQLIGSEDSPDPDAVLAMGKVWKRADVLAWARAHGRLVEG
jgi:hypothetical protein